MKDTLTRQQFGGTLGFPIKKDKTFLFVGFEGLRQNAQNAVPLLTNTNIFLPTNAQNAIIAQLEANPSPVPVACLPAVPLAALTAADAFAALFLQGALTLNPAASPLDAFLLNQFETEGGLFPFNTREYLVSARLDHRFNANNEISVTYRYGHDLEESPDVNSLTAFSAGSSIHDYDNTLQASLVPPAQSDHAERSPGAVGTTTALM